MFDLNIFERVAYLMLWFVHGIILGNLSFVTVVGYVSTAIDQYTTSNYVGKREMWLTLTVYIVSQLAMALVGLVYAKDTVMYMVAGELKDLCEKYGAFC